ncbi:MAG: hypothetical protein LC624_11055 [Halobacteriales archaeon]|nr:hypothetical protein [Halobacteriales archaeon]
MPPHGDEVRAQLVEHVRRDPGMALIEAARLLGVNASTASYHARVLVRRRGICAVPVGRRVALFAAGDGSCPWMRALLPELRDPAVQSAAAQLLQGPVQVGTLARTLGVPRARAARVLRRLENLGACERTRSGVGRAPPQRLPCLERAVLRQRCSKLGTCDPLARTEERLPDPRIAFTPTYEPRHDTLSPSPKGRMSVSTPGVLDARRL